MALLLLGDATLAAGCALAAHLRADPVLDVTPVCKRFAVGKLNLTARVIRVLVVRVFLRIIRLSVIRWII
jgi:hypothetical protein